MKYPTPEEIENASQFQLGNWYRHLPYAETEEQSVAIDQINERFMGFTPELSKQVGWDPK